MEMEEEYMVRAALLDHLLKEGFLSEQEVLSAKEELLKILRQEESELKVA